MEIAKASDDDKAYFRSIVPAGPGVEVKAMFGNLAAFVNGNMFMGLLGRYVGIRLDETGRGELMAVAGAGPFGPDGRPMKEYVAMPAAWRTDPKSTDLWIRRALKHTAAKPAKKANK